MKARLPCSFFAILLGACAPVSTTEDDRVASMSEEIWSAGWSDVPSPAGGAYSRVALLSESSTSLDVFVHGMGSGWIGRRTWRDGYWSDWSTFDSGSSVVIDSALAAGDAGSQAWLVGRGADGRVYHRTRHSPSRTGLWGAWTDTGAGEDNREDPVLSTVPSRNEAHLWTLSWPSSNTVSYRIWQGSSWLTSWAQSPAAPGMIVSAPAVVRINDSAVGVAVATTAGARYKIWYRTFNPVTNTWPSPISGLHVSSGWIEVDSATTSLPQDVSLSVNGSGVISLWAAPPNSLSNTIRMKRFSLRSRPDAISAMAWEGVPGSAGNGTLLQVTSLRRGSDPTTGTDLFVYSPLDNALRYRQWYDATDAGSVLAQDRALAADVNGDGATTCTEASINWTEYAALGMAPPAAGSSASAYGCTSGKVLFSMSNRQEIWSAPLSCFTSPTAQVCSPGGYPAGTPDSPQCNAAVVQSGANLVSLAKVAGVTLTVPGNLGRTDSQIVRIPAHGASPASIIMVHQALVDKTFASPLKQKREVELVYRSTDCGDSWALAGVADPCDTAVLNGATCPAAASYDRPEVLATPDGSVYLTVFSKGNNSARLLNSLDAGSNWTVDWDPAEFHANIPMAAEGSNLFAVNCEDTGSTNTVLWFGKDASGKRFANKAIIAGPGAPVPSAPCRFFGGTANGNWMWHVSVVGTYADGTYLRVVYPTTPVVPDPATLGRQQYALVFVKVSGSTATPVAAPVILEAVDDAGAPVVNGSVNQMVMVDSDSLDGPPGTPGNQSNVALLTWLQTTYDPAANAYGNVSMMGCILRDFSTCAAKERFQISKGLVDGMAVGRSWTDFASTGDYRKEAFFYDPTETSGRNLKFLTHWTETPAGGKYLLHASLVSVQP